MKRNIALAVSGWLFTFITMILVKDGNVGAALSALPTIVVGFIAVSAVIAGVLAKKTH